MFAAAAIILSALPWTQASIVDIEQAFVSIPRSVTPFKDPQLVLIHIDKESLDSSDITKGKEYNPISREYLASLVRQLTQSQVRSIAIDYVLEEPCLDKSNTILTQSIRDAEVQNINFVLASAKEENNKKLCSYSNKENILSRQLGLGNINFPEDFGNFPQNIRPWNRTENETIPFSYFLAMMQEESINSNLDWIGGIIKNSKINSLPNFQPWLVSLLIDYSHPPDSVYTRISARNLLEKPKDYDLKNKVILIAPGGYPGAGINQKIESEDNYKPLPIAVAIRSSFGLTNNKDNVEYFANDRPFTGSESHAYTAHQLLNNSVIIRISDSVIIIVALIGCNYVFEIKNAKKLYRKNILIIIPFVYAGACIGIYYMMNISIPFLLSCILYFIFLDPIDLKNNPG